MIILTDGNQTKTGKYTPLDIASQPLKNKGVRIVTVGVGDIDAEQMKVLSPDSRDRFNPKTFADLLPLVETMFSSGLCTGKWRLLLVQVPRPFSESIPLEP